MKYVYLFLPAIGWGLMPLVIASVKNSTVYNQIVGTVAASFIFGAIVMAIMHPAMSWSLFLLSAYFIPWQNICTLIRRKQNFTHFFLRS